MQLHTLSKNDLQRCFEQWKTRWYTFVKCQEEYFEKRLTFHLLFISVLVNKTFWSRYIYIYIYKYQPSEEAVGKGDGLTKHVSWLEPNRTSLGDPQAEGGGVQSLKYLPAPRRHHGGVKEHFCGYQWISGKLHAQESKIWFGLVSFMAFQPL